MLEKETPDKIKDLVEAMVGLIRNCKETTPVDVEVFNSKVW